MSVFTETRSSVQSLCEQLVEVFVARNERLSDTEWHALGVMIQRIVSPLPKMPRIVRDVIENLVVPVFVDLVVIHRGRVLLTYGKRGSAISSRSSMMFPESSLCPGRTWFVAAKECAKYYQIGVDIVSAKLLITENNFLPEQPSENSVSVLLQCECAAITDNQFGVEWHSEAPESLIPCHRRFWKHIEPLLF